MHLRVRRAQRHFIHAALVLHLYQGRRGLISYCRCFCRCACSFEETHAFARLELSYPESHQPIDCYPFLSREPVQRCREITPSTLCSLVLMCSFIFIVEYDGLTTRMVLCPGCEEYHTTTLAAAQDGFEGERITLEYVWITNSPVSRLYLHTTSDLFGKEPKVTNWPKQPGKLLGQHVFHEFNLSVVEHKEIEPVFMPIVIKTHLMPP